MTRFFTALLLALALVGSSACTRRDAEERPPAVDAALMAYLSQARALHHTANLQEDAGDFAAAAGSMERLVGAPRPPGGEAASPEVAEVLADANARLAELRVKEGDLERASAAIRAGLALAPEPTYFRGHLFEVDGILEEARAKKLAAEGKTADAAEAKKRALSRLEEAVKIQEQVIQRALAREAGR